MTGGIGVMCNHGDTIIVAADMRATYTGMSVDPHDLTGKLYDFAPFNLVAAIAGSTSSTHAIISELSDWLRGYVGEKLKNPDGLMVMEHIRNALEKSRKKELRRLQSCEMEVQLGCGLKEWLSGKLPTGEPFNEYAHKWGLQVLRNVRDHFRNKVGIIVGGFLETGPVFFRGLGFELEDAASPAVYVIGGKGAIDAMKVLIKRGQNVEMGLARSLFHIYEAMKAAKIDVGVGEPAAYTVMRPYTVDRPQGMLRFHPDHPMLRQWSKTYRNRSTEPLESREANELVKRGMVPERVPNSQWLGPKTLVGKL